MHYRLRLTVCFFIISNALPLQAGGEHTEQAHPFYKTVCGVILCMVPFRNKDNLVEYHSYCGQTCSRYYHPEENATYNCFVPSLSKTCR